MDTPQNKDLLIQALASVIDPTTKKDIVSLHLVKSLELSEEGNVVCSVELKPQSKPFLEQLRAIITDTLQRLDIVTSVDLDLKIIESEPAPKQDGLSDVKHIIAVSSCKGGVGKSTVAVNLAYSLRAQGQKVGIFDADIYGPSLPTMVAVPNPSPRVEGQAIFPIEHHGVDLMSFGFIQHQMEKEGPAIMRGPMVSQVISQLLLGTQWGELDTLIIDFPPGTGDIQLTLGQIAPITAAVIVTSPQHLSFIDVVKGIEMFDTLKIPTISVVENMSYFTCDNCETKHRIFGAGAKRRLVHMYGIQNAFEIPMDPAVSPAGDTGEPLVVADSEHPITAIFDTIATSVTKEMETIENAPEKGYHFHVDDEGLHVLYDEVEKAVHSFWDLRASCRCAKCEDEFTGEPLLDKASIPDDIHCLSIGTVGNYAVAVDWSDGHHSLYPLGGLDSGG